jgi:hypothetical protein
MFEYCYFNVAVHIPCFPRELMPVSVAIRVTGLWRWMYLHNITFLDIGSVLL